MAEHLLRDSVVVSFVGPNAAQLGLIGLVSVSASWVRFARFAGRLGYSAVKFGVGSVVLVVGATVGAVAAQAAVLKVGVRPVAATGMALMGVGRQFSRTSP